MKKDIHLPKVENIAVAIVKEDSAWNVYLLNLKKKDIEGVIVASKGYGKKLARTGRSSQGLSKKEEKVNTSVLRHFWEKIPAKSFVKIEPIMNELFQLSNEYWVSFYQNKMMYDKKYVFVAGSIAEKNLIAIPLMNKKGVMIK